MAREGPVHASSCQSRFYWRAVHYALCSCCCGWPTSFFVCLCDARRQGTRLTSGRINWCILRFCRRLLALPCHMRPSQGGESGMHSREPLGCVAGVPWAGVSYREKCASSAAARGAKSLATNGRGIAHSSRRELAASFGYCEPCRVEQTQCVQTSGRCYAMRHARPCCVRAFAELDHHGRLCPHTAVVRVRSRRTTIP